MTLGPHSSLWGPLDATRSSSRPQLSVWDGAAFVEWTWDDWRSAALGVAAGLRRLGVEDGERVACVLTNSPQSCAWVLGTWLAGGTVVSMPAIARGVSPSLYLNQLRAICREAQPHLVAVDAPFLDAVSSSLHGWKVISFGGLSQRRRIDAVPPAATRELFVQYSSGSTGDPRGCVLTGDAISHQLAAMADALEIHPDRDRGVSWLPLSHDMGLFGCLLMSYWTGIQLVIGSPQRFLRNPMTWLQDCAHARATMTAAPNFALEVVARLGRRRTPPPFRLRVCVVGGDRVEASTLARLNATLGDERFPKRCFTPAYGLAEAVLAVTVTPVSEAPRIKSVDARALQEGIVVPVPSDADGSALITSAGAPIRDTKVVAGDVSRVSEIRVSSPALATSYLGQERLSRRVFTSDGLKTGDLGFVDQDEVFVAGRIDDMLCVAGRNVFARDVEAELANAPGLRAGCSALVDSREGQRTQLVLLTESADTSLGLDGIARRAARLARESAGVSINVCCFLPRGTMPKTPSGKIQRFRCRELVLDPPRGSHLVRL